MEVDYSNIYGNIFRCDKKKYQIVFDFFYKYVKPYVFNVLFINALPSL